MTNPATKRDWVGEAREMAEAIIAWCDDRRAEPVILGSQVAALLRLCQEWPDSDQPELSS